MGRGGQHESENPNGHDLYQQVPDWLWNGPLWNGPLWNLWDNGGEFSSYIVHARYVGAPL